MIRPVVASLERLSTNPLIEPSQILFTRASGAFNPGVSVDYVSGRARLFIMSGLYLLALALFVLGTLVVMTLPVVPKG